MFRADVLRWFIKASVSGDLSIFIDSTDHGAEKLVHPFIQINTRENE